MGTRSGYKSDWKEWLVFLEKERGEVGGGDVYLDQVRDDTERAAMLALFFKGRYDEGGMRGKAATTAGAGIRHAFIRR